MEFLYQEKILQKIQDGGKGEKGDGILGLEREGDGILGLEREGRWKTRIGERRR